MVAGLERIVLCCCFIRSYGGGLLKDGGVKVMIGGIGVMLELRGRVAEVGRETQVTGIWSIVRCLRRLEPRQ